MPVVRTDGRSVGHVITKFSGIGRFIYPWYSAGALRARSSSIIIIIMIMIMIIIIIIHFSKSRGLLQ